MILDRILGVAICAAMLSVGTAYAGVIYDNGGPNHVTGPTADAGNGEFPQAADEFALTAGNNTIAGINWWGFCTSGRSGTCSSTNSFTLDFYNDSSGAPGTLVTSFTGLSGNQTATGQSVSAGPFTEYAYSASIANLPLTVGTTYWLGISDTSSPSDGWSWEEEAQSGGDAYIFLNGTTWDNESYELAFNLDGPAAPTSAVPEPDSLAIMGAGLLGLIGLRRRRRMNRI